MSTIYNTVELVNLLTNEQAEEAFNKKLITEESKEKIKEVHPVKLYTPNIFIAIAISLATIIAVIFSTGLYCLVAWNIIKSDEDITVVGSLIFLGLCYYGVLEIMVKKSRFYNAGVDNTLQLVVAAYLFAAFVYNKNELNYTTAFLVLTIISGWLSFRFNDAFMACVSYLSFLAFFLFFSKQAGAIIAGLLPFIIMLTSFLCYGIVTRIKKNPKFLLFTYRTDCLKVVSLITFYAAGNYFVVKELNDSATGNIPGFLSVIFWLWTCIIPLAYIIYGIAKKDLVVVRTGGILIAAIVFTVRYYYSVLPIETAMFIGGILLIGISYWLIKYLSIPKRGFTSKEIYKKNSAGVNIEALIIAQTFGKTGDTAGNEHTTFGGGTSGGGGASGSFD
ncbi:hypothetical protein ACI6Q2_02260 [Chitinophagaceae bacterium LWZ2-11]